MKKIICLILALTCSFALFSCNEEEEIDETLAKFLEVVEASEPTNITTQTTHTRPNGVYYTGMYETEMTEEGFVFTYDYEERAPITAEGGDSSILTKIGTVVYDGNRYTINGGEPTAEAPNVAYMQIKLDLSAETIGEYRTSRDGNTLTATLTAEAAEAIFGIEFSAETVELTITVAGDRLSRVTLTYTTAEGTEVIVETSYTYESAQDAQ